MQELKDLTELVTQVRLDIRELGTEIKNLRDLGPKVDAARDISLKALDSATTANSRVEDIEATLEKMRDSQNWLPRTITAAVVSTVVGGFVGASITMLLK